MGARAGVALLAAPALAMTVAACASSSSNSSTSSSGSSAAATGLQQQYENAVTSVLPSVVQIFTSDATGSGVVYDSKGDIITNAHVVGSESTVQVVPATGGDTLTAKVLGTFPAGDLAVIRVESDASKLKVATFGDSGNVKAGQIVLAM